MMPTAKRTYTRRWILGALLVVAVLGSSASADVPKVGRNEGNVVSPCPPGPDDVTPGEGWVCYANK